MEYKLIESETELKPCPFCGSDGAVVRMGGSYFVMCETCTCCRVKGYGSEAAAIEAWNTRSERTCRIESVFNDDWEYPIWDYELSCGHSFEAIIKEAPTYCPECGAKVVEE